jgi:23S rRNA (adenine2503-C2)-methyltransferase
MEETIDNPVILKGQTILELESFFLSIGEPKFRAKQFFEGVYKNRYSSIDQFTNFSRTLKDKLKEVSIFQHIQKRKEMVSQLDGTTKFTFDVADQKEVEAVWIPDTLSDRKTICISSQVGCTLACAFCATGRLNFKGNLHTWQILDQVLAVEEAKQDKATNIVFMGMGEPMHNYYNVLRAANILNHPSGFGIGAKRITISTAGDVKGIHRYIDNREPYNFAISLNHPDASGRKEIMDISEKFPLEELLAAARKFTKELKRRITFEYVMIPGVNMGKINADKLVKIARSVDCKINLIPLNTTFNNWRKPTEIEIEEFRSIVLTAGVPVINRRSPGKDIDGACGMLALAGK